MDVQTTFAVGCYCMSAALMNNARIGHSALRPISTALEALQKPVEAYGSQTPTRASYPVYVLNEYEYVHCCTCMRFRAVLVHKQERIIC